MFVFTNLSVEGVDMKLVDTFECFSVDLLECYPVGGAVKYVYLLHHVVLAPDVLTLPGEGDLRVSGPLGGLVVLGVIKHQEGDPQLLHLMEGESVL